jgi:hypothetical protein
MFTAFLARLVHDTLQGIHCSGCISLLAEP